MIWLVIDQILIVIIELTRSIEMSLLRALDAYMLAIIREDISTLQIFTLSWVIFYRPGPSVWSDRIFLAKVTRINLKQKLYIYIYIYIYMCVCVCVWSQDNLWNSTNLCEKVEIEVYYYILDSYE